MENITESVSLFISGTGYGKIPEDVCESCKWHILDTLGCMLAGSQEKAAKIVKDYVTDFCGGTDSSVIPGGPKTSPQYAALANAVSGHALDFDDYEWPSMAHSSVTVLPGVLALGEMLGASGKACLEAYLVGMEVISKIGIGINPNHYEKGWHSTCTIGTLGAASACSKLLKLTPEEIRMAIGMAASMSGGLRENFGTMTKPFHAGQAARGGVEAGLLVSRGFTADKNILEANLGYCNMFTENQDYDLKKITSNLGSPFSIISPGLGKKLYPSCAATHSTLDAIFYLIDQYDIHWADVDEVACGIFYLYPKMLIHTNPRTGLEGKFSLEFCVALALKERNVGLSQFTDSKVGEPEIQELIKRVRRSVTEEVGGRGTQYPGATVTVTLKDGTGYHHHVKKRKGSPVNPLVKDEIIDKFMDCARMIHSKDHADRIADTVMGMEHLNDIGTLVKLLS
ncbi:MmgE/PrpD family protein [bacterium]|nr:MmgE/PrpD family protein [bacterium]